MEVETLLAISAGVTFLLAIAAFWVIWQNYQLHKKERKERLLNEIIDWATRCARCGYEVHISIPHVYNAYNKAKMELEVLDKTAASARVLSIESTYINSIVSTFDDAYKKEVSRDVLNVINKLDIVWKQAFNHMQKYKELGLPSEKEVKELRESAQTLIEKAAKIKTEI